jgi:hypothetical protein
MDNDDSTFVHVSSPVGSIMSRIMAKAALKDSDALREVARKSGNEHLTKQAAKKLLDYERHAEQSQLLA